MGKNPPHNNARFVLCVNNADYPASLELYKIYRVVPDKEAEADVDIRVVLTRAEKITSTPLCGSLRSRSPMP